MTAAASPAIATQVWISRVRLNTAEIPCVRLISSVYLLHGFIMGAFPTPLPPEERVLFRVEPRRRNSSEIEVLIQSTAVPKWGPGVVPRGADLDPSRELSPMFTRGARVRFRIRANPTYRERTGSEKAGRRLSYTNESEFRGWLVRKAESAGFDLGPFSLVDEKMIEADKGGKRLRFRSVLFDGRLIVREPGAFACALVSGLGSAKGLGFGLLSVARCNDEDPESKEP